MQAPQPPAAPPCAPAGGAAAAEQALPQALQHERQQPQLDGAPLQLADARQGAQEAAPGPAAAAAGAGGDTRRQTAADACTGGAGGGSTAGGSHDTEEAAAAEPGAMAEGEEYDEELAAWLAGRLQRMQPGAELTVGSVKVLGKLLDEITVRVLEEAQRVSAGEAAGSSVPAPEAGADAAAAGPPAASSSAAAAAGPAVGQCSERRGKQGQAKASALTSLDIHKALKRVLPGEPAENKLRPYLPTVTKQAWHLDKQSLKGIKRQKQAAGAAVSGTAAGAAGAGAAADEPAAGGAASKENQQQQMDA